MSEVELLMLVRRARLQYEEMPGLALTIPQAARLWRLEPDIVEDVMAALVDAEFLCLGRAGFIRRRAERRTSDRRAQVGHA